MSKTTNLLVALGVVASLGIAALPLSAMAVTDNNGVTVIDGVLPEGETEKAGELHDGNADGNVEDQITVKTTIESALSITIVGDDDASGEAGQKHLVLLGDNGKIMNGGNASGAAKVTVATNHLGGYQVKMNGEADGFNGVTNTDEKFGKVADDSATFPVDGDSVFGYQTTAESTVTNVTLANANWNGVPTAATLIATGKGATASAGDTFTITFQAHASESQAADTYDEVVTITATTNLAPTDESA